MTTKESCDIESENNKKEKYETAEGRYEVVRSMTYNMNYPLRVGDFDVEKSRKRNKSLAVTRNFLHEILFIH